MFLLTVRGAVLLRLLDKNKRVQHSACSALSVLEEELMAEVTPYIGNIAECMSKCFLFYRERNLMVLYDAVSTLAETTGEGLNKPQYLELLLPPLIQKWNEIPDNDRQLLPLLECLSAVATAVGPSFGQFATPVFTRCVRLIEATLQQQQQAASDPAHYEQPEKEFMICALDLISGLVEGLKQDIEPFLESTNLPQMIVQAASDTGPDVRQSAFALMGDLSKYAIQYLHPVLSDLLSIASRNLDPHWTSVCNNSVWAMGEVAMQVGPQISYLIPTVLPRLIALVNRRVLNANLLENTAITIGRFGLANPDMVAPHLPSFVQFWCYTLRNIRDDVEKESAFRGLCEMINRNPDGVVRHLLFVCDAIASWGTIPDDLRQIFHELLYRFKQSLGTSWDPFFAKFPGHLKQTLHAQYGL